MTRKLKTALKYKGDRRKILLSMYFKKDPLGLKMYKELKYKSFYFAMIGLWNKYALPSTPLIPSTQLKRFVPKYIGDSFSYTIPYKISK